MAYRDEHEALIARNAALEDEVLALRQHIAERDAPPQRASSGSNAVLGAAAAGFVLVLGAGMVLMRGRPEPLPTPLDLEPLSESSSEDPLLAAAFGSADVPDLDKIAAPDLDKIGMLTTTTATVRSVAGMLGVGVEQTCSIERRLRLDQLGTEPNTMPGTMLIRCGITIVYDSEHEAAAAQPIELTPPPDSIGSYDGGQDILLSRKEPPLRIVLHTH